MYILKYVIMNVGNFPWPLFYHLNSELVRMEREPSNCRWGNGHFYGRRQNQGQLEGLVENAGNAVSGTFLALRLTGRTSHQVFASGQPNSFLLD